MCMDKTVTKECHFAGGDSVLEVSVSRSLAAVLCTWDVLSSTRPSVTKMSSFCMSRVVMYNMDSGVSIHGWMHTNLITCVPTKVPAKYIQLWLGLSTLCQRADSITEDCTHLWSEKRFFVIWMTRLGIRSAPSATSEYESNLYLSRNKWQRTLFNHVYTWSMDGNNIVSL